MATPLWIRKMLQLRGLHYRELHHANVYTAQEVAQREHVSGHRVAKVVVLMVDERPVEAVLPASRYVNLDKIRELFDAEDVRLATEVEMERMFIDSEVGAIPPLRHWKFVRVLMDRELSVEGDIVFQAGTHTDAIQLDFEDWYELVKPQVAAFSEAVGAVHH